MRRHVIGVLLALLTTVAVACEIVPSPDAESTQIPTVSPTAVANTKTLATTRPTPVKSPAAVASPTPVSSPTPVAPPTPTDSPTPATAPSPMPTATATASPTPVPTPAIPDFAFVVNSNNDADDGMCDLAHCSLREAINAADAQPGSDSIGFNITNPGPHTIQPASQLPTITGPLVIDGYTQTGASPNTNGPSSGSNAVLMIELDGTAAGFPTTGLHITAGSSIVRGLVINRFSGGNLGGGIKLETNGDNLIEGNFIGTDVSGSTGLENGWHGVMILDTSDNTIGGTKSEARNVISGNNSGGVHIEGDGAINNLVRGNLIGTDAAGRASVGNGVHGVHIVDASNNTVGGTTVGARNVISGNKFLRLRGDGIAIAGNTSTGNLIVGNFIGTDVTGDSDLGNNLHGVIIENAPGNTIGGTTNGARNIISGNGITSTSTAYGGIKIFGSGSTGNRIQGNFIGTNVGGAVSLGNTEFGVVIAGRPSGNIVGGNASGARNVISGNEQTGVRVEFASENLVHGNYIGTDATGNSDLGNAGHGVEIYGASNNTIGGATDEARNIISGNEMNGVYITGAAATENRVQGNFIGVATDGVSDLGNGRNGVYVSQGANNSVGGVATTAANVISFNDMNGVVFASENGNAVLSNSIHSNIALGIDLMPSGVTANDSGDNDTGANNLQNFPLLTSASVGDGIVLDGTLNTTESATIRLEFFASRSCDSSSSGEGEMVLGSTVGTTDDSGGLTFSITFPAPIPAARYVTATATDADGNSSEFSPRLEVG